MKGDALGANSVGDLTVTRRKLARPAVDLNIGTLTHHHARNLARLLNRARQLTNIAGQKELRGERYVELNNHSVSLRNMTIVTCCSLYLNLIRRQLDARDPYASARKELHCTFTCRLHHRLHRCAKSLPDLWQEHLDAPFKESRGIIHLLDMLDIQLIPEDGEEFCWSRGTSAKDHAREAQWLSRANPCG
jgi:hypothetical protein